MKQKKFFNFVCFLIFFLSFSFDKINAEKVILSTSPAQVCFTPFGDCTDLITKTIGQAKKSVLVQAYSFTSDPIADALIDARRHGVRVEVLLDKSQPKARYSAISYLSESGVPTYIDDKHAIAHNKIIIIDGETVITGSFNFTNAAEEKNAENLMIINSEELAKIYTANFKLHKSHSVIYEDKEK